MTTENARQQHYYFVHEYLRTKCLLASAVAMDEFWDVEAPKHLQIAWAALGLLHKHPSEPFIPADGIDVRPFLVDKYRGVIITFPTPVAPSEAFMIGFVAPNDVKINESCDSRYFTLELSPPRSNGTVLCEWTAHGHQNLGEGPVPDVETFRGVVETEICRAHLLSTRFAARLARNWLEEIELQPLSLSDFTFFGTEYADTDPESEDEVPVETAK